MRESDNELEVMTKSSPITRLLQEYYIIEVSAKLIVLKYFQKDLKPSILVKLNY